MLNAVTLVRRVADVSEQVPDHVMLPEYDAFRASTLSLSPGYCELKALEERYLVDHDEELAEIAEDVFVSGLLGVRFYRNVLRG